MCAQFMPRTIKDRYPETRQWAMAIHAQAPDIQGLCWTSRQDDRAQAVMLFGDRIAPGTLKPQGDSRNLVQDTDTYIRLLLLADLIGARIVPGKSP